MVNQWLKLDSLVAFFGNYEQQMLHFGNGVVFLALSDFKLENRLKKFVREVGNKSKELIRSYQGLS